MLQELLRLNYQLLLELLMDANQLIKGAMKSIKEILETTFGRKSQLQDFENAFKDRTKTSEPTPIQMQKEGLLIRFRKMLEKDELQRDVWENRFRDEA